MLLTETMAASFPGLSHFSNMSFAEHSDADVTITEHSDADVTITTVSN
uniref:Uncharacterized protein n=1 Tax=Anguilla anguilla TaxID=7936 RepID=A0A0E9UZF6_ANGAN